MNERLAIMEQKVEQIEHVVADHETRIRAGEKSMQKFIGGLVALQIIVSVVLHLWR